MKRNVFPSRPVLERFWEKVEQVTESGCWLWTARCDSKGYARFWNDRKAHEGGHRFAYRFFKGPIPEGLELDHLCRVPCCVNPDHLEPVTGRENVLRGKSRAAEYAKRTHCQYGHKLVRENIYPYGNTRACKTCARLNRFKWYADNRSCKREYRPQRDTKIFLERML